MDRIPRGVLNVALAIIIVVIVGAPVLSCIGCLTTEGLGPMSGVLP